ncbi:hypothetical protein [Rhizobium gallicum]|uniref:hypothetical protein n=1 Tax=Rhizobium gallicum TaxID=56730 RepID=UPI001EF91194|nr:hypothetical protein [Rhizobium gallicum]ULJ72634.1 hypothetical protein L2W42_02760 [Rhizobium gallicum]
MSRGEELRKKFAAKAAASQFNEQMAEFVVRLDKFLIAERHASAASSAFVDRIYAEFTAEQPIDLDAWFRQKLSGLFVSVGKKPEWVFEPS